MNQLIIPLSAVRGEGVAVDAVVSTAEWSTDIAQALSIREVTVSGILMAVDSEYLFQGTIAGVFKHPCDRCLEVTEQPVVMEVAWYFEPGNEEGALESFEEIEEDEDSPEDDRPRYFQGREIDLGPHVVEEVVLAAPSKSLCKEDCAGLCSRCGADLNKGTCGCPSQDEMGKTGLSALADLFPDLKSEPSEE